MKGSKNKILNVQEKFLPLHRSLMIIDKEVNQISMTIQEFRDYMASGKPVVGGGEVHMMFHKLSQEALRITAEINGKYHTPEELPYRLWKEHRRW